MNETDIRMSVAVVMIFVMVAVCLFAVWRFWRQPPEPTYLETLRELNNEAMHEHLDACAALETAQARVNMLDNRMLRLQGAIERATS